MMQQDTPEEIVIAKEVQYSMRAFVASATKKLGMKQWIITSKTHFLKKKLLIS